MLGNIGKLATNFPKMMGKLTITEMEDEKAEETVCFEFGREGGEELSPQKLEAVLNKALLQAHNAPPEKLDELREKAKAKIEQIVFTNRVKKKSHFENRRK